MKEQDASARYHHGDLRAALLAAAGAELDERGLAAFSLRATAKRAGVSHAAPAHHFGNTQGLLRELAKRGFAALADEMERRAARADDPSDRLVEVGLGYVTFASARPALFELMFGGTLSDAAGSQEGNRAFGILVGRAGTSEGDVDWHRVAAAWALVHGLAQLRSAGRMTFLDRMERDADDADDVLRDVLRAGLGKRPDRR